MGHKLTTRAMNDVTKLTDIDLLQHIANAQVTGMGALGHNKAAMNERQEAQLRKEALRRNISAPDDLWRTGVFNGPGAV